MIWHSQRKPNAMSSFLSEYIMWTNLKTDCFVLMEIVNSLYMAPTGVVPISVYEKWTMAFYDNFLQSNYDLIIEVD